MSATRNLLNVACASYAPGLVLVMLGGIWHYLDVARAIDEGNYRSSRMRIVVPALIVVLLGSASLVWLLW